MKWGSFIKNQETISIETGQKKFKNDLFIDKDNVKKFVLDTIQISSSYIKFQRRYYKFIFTKTHVAENYLARVGPLIPENAD